MKITEKAIQHPFPVILILVSIFIASLISYMILPLELVPKIEVPYAFVTATYIGAAPDEIESDVIKTLEDKLSGLADINTITSYAMQNMCFISIKFSPDSDIDESMDNLREKVNEALPELPNEVENVTVTELDFSAIPISILNIYGDFSPHELQIQAERVKDKLTRISGVNTVEMFGGLEREIKVVVDGDLLLANQLSISQIILALQRTNINMPGGILKIGDNDILLRTVGKYHSINEIGHTIIALGRQGNPIRLEHVAEVIDGYEDAQSYSRFNQLNSVTLMISKTPGAHIVEATNEIEEVVSEASHQFPKGMQFEYTARQATDIERQAKQLNTNAILGIILIIIVLLFGIGFRNALIVSMALPFALITSFLFMYLFDIDRTGIAMFGLIMVLGIVVDGAIIVAESTYRFIEEGMRRRDAAVEAMREVGIPILTAGLTTMVAFAPIMFMSGIMGQFLSVIPKVVIFTLIGAFIADHFMIPVVSSKLMSKSKTSGGLLSGEWFGRRHYTTWLRWVLKHRAITLISAFVFFISSLVIVGISMTTDIKLVKVQMFPAVPQPRIIADITTDPGSQLEYTDQIASEIEDYLITIPEIDRFVSTVGASGVQNVRLAQGGGTGAEIAQINMDLVDEKYRDRTVDDIIEELSERWGALPGVDVTFGKIVEGPPIATNVVIDIFGDDLGKMEWLSDEIKSKMETIPGAINVTTSKAIRRNEFQVNIDHDRAANYGISSQEISQTVAAAVYGIEATTYTDDLEEIPIRVKLDFNNQTAVDAITSLNIPNQMGLMIPFANVADLNLSSGQTLIRHRNFDRNVSVQCDMAPGVDASDIRRKMDPFLSSLSIPAGIEVEYGGIEDEAAESFKSLGIGMVIGFFIIMVILSAQFRSLKQPLIIGIAIPLSFVGVIIGLMVTRVPFGLMAFFGIVALMGVVVNDAIVLISYINDLRKSGMNLQDAMIKGGRNRLRPIILTTITTLAGMIPLAFNFTGGMEYWQPLAVSLIFGLAVSSFLTLFVIPVLYSLFEGRGERKRLELLENSAT